MKYKILWLEDQPEDDTKAQALEFYQCELINFTTAEEAIKELKSENIHSYDGILLDVIGFKESEQDATSSNGFYAFKEKFTELRHLNLPCAILTANPNLKSDSSMQEFKNTVQGMDVFKKSSQGQDDCFAYLLTEIDKRDDTKIIKQYETQFEFLKSEGFNSDDYQNLLSILKDIESENILQSKPFAAMRVILDGVLETLFCSNILDRSEPLIYRGSAISQNCQKLLAGKIVKDRQGRFIKLSHGKKVSSSISHLMSFIYGLGTNDGHNQGQEEWGFTINETADFTSKHSLLKSTVHSLLLVLEYFANWHKSEAAHLEIEERLEGVDFTDTFTRVGYQFHSAWGREFRPSFGYPNDLKDSFSEGDQFQTKVKWSKSPKGGIEYFTSPNLSDYQKITR